MKKIFSLYLALLSSFSILGAQNVQNGGFEQQTITTLDTVPTGWAVDPIGFQFTTDAHSGNYAMQLWNWYYYAEGWAVYGDASSGFDLGGHPISFVPDKLNGWYKYIYGDNGGAADSAVCEVIVFSRQNFTGARDTLVFERFMLGPSAEYAPFEVPLTNHNPGILPDTLCIRFFSSINGFCNSQGNGNCLYLNIDDVEVSSATGFSQSLDEERAIQLYPNPSNVGFQLKASANQFPLNLAVHDLQGRLVLEETVYSSQSRLGQALRPGIYLISILDAAGNRNTRKLEVQ